MTVFTLITLAAGLSIMVPVTHDSPIGPGWSRTSVNTTIFRQSAVTSHGDFQYCAYYDADASLILAKRRIGTDKWSIQKTQYRGNARDAHNSISIGVDGSGYLHVSWDHHGNPLNYTRSISPGSLKLRERLSMTGLNEKHVTYPEFYNLPDYLVFLYRDGGSGQGDTLLNIWDNSLRKWTPLAHPLISGEGQRNAYTNGLAIDATGIWHLSWCWRETGDVATNHDICYAKSADMGKTWTKSTGEPYTLPITQKTAEVALAIPQNSDLINTTSTAVDTKGHPIIATYFRQNPGSRPQYCLIWHDGRAWHTNPISNRTADFTLKGGGTKKIPISRPKLAVTKDGEIAMLFRDDQRGARISVATSKDRKRWRVTDLTDSSVGSWEPNFDKNLFIRTGILNIFKQKVEQGDAEREVEINPQSVSILEWKP